MKISYFFMFGGKEKSRLKVHITIHNSQISESRSIQE